MVDLLQAIDIYCERTSAAFWAEPLNAISNFGFPLAALWAGVQARARGISNTVTWALIVMAGVIGVGSFLFHTFANGWAALADTIPIWAFVALFVLTAMHLIGGMKPGRVAVIGAVVAAVLVVIVASGEGTADKATGPDPLNGSGQYAPALLALAVFAALSWWRGHPQRHWVIAAAAVFCVSLVFRTVDMRICAAFPYGTHFVWHLLNALMIGLLLQVLVRSAPPSRM